MWRQGRMVFLSLAAASAAAAATSGDTSADASLEFGATRFALAPTLIENHEPELCEAVLKGTLTGFRSSDLQARVDIENVKNVTWIEWPERPDTLAGIGFVHRLEADLDGTGRQQTIVYWSFVHSWRGDNYHLYVAPDGAVLDEWMKKGGTLGALSNEARGYGQTDMQPLPAREVYPIAESQDDDGPKDIGSTWYAPQLFQWRDHTYLMTDIPVRPQEDPAPVSVYRLRADATLERQCHIGIPDRDQALETALGTSGVAAFTEHLSRIGGNDSGGCGTLNSQGRHFNDAMISTRNTVLRPWAVSRYDATIPYEYHVYNPRLIAFMDDWSRFSAWDRVTLLQFRNHVPLAVERYAAALTRNFGMTPDAARRSATSVIGTLVAAWIAVPHNYGAEEPGDEPEQPALTALLINRNLEALTAALSNREALLAPARVYPQRKPPVSALSLPLHEAVLWPRGLEAMLKAGADVNAQNRFGKTPLMTAAHLNRPDAVRALLRHKADVKARTDPRLEDCGYSIERGRRTALMYAAENAGFETIELLLNAGTDPDAKDSYGNGVELYLARNPRFAPLPEGTTLKSFLATSRKESSPARCTGSKQSVEATICRDEILRLYDTEIREARAQLLKIDGKAVEVDQQTWLTERDSCTRLKDEAAVGCLQDALLARSRFLWSLVHPARMD
jgi:uncharacterized protein YecT (DUF1311 family)